MPVNFLRAKDGQARIYQEKISFEHQYNSRIDPNYPMRNKVRLVVKVFDNKNNGHFYNTEYFLETYRKLLTFKFVYH